MTESLTYRMQLCKDRYNDIPQCLINEVQVMEDKSAIYKKRPSKPYEENKTTKSLTGRLINLFHRCDSSIRLDSISLTDEVRALEAENAELKEHRNELSKEVDRRAGYLAEMFKMETTMKSRYCSWKAAEKERDELKAQLEDCTAVNAEVMKKVARLEKSINNQESDSN